MHKLTRGYAKIGESYCDQVQGRSLSHSDNNNNNYLFNHVSARSFKKLVQNVNVKANDFSNQNVA